MKFTTDIRYIAIQTLKFIVLYLIGAFIVLCFLRPKYPYDFLIGSSLACTTVFLGVNFPRKICVQDGVITFNRINSCEKCEVKVSDIVKVEVDLNLYNTLTFRTKFGNLYRIHPKEIQTLETKLSQHLNNRHSSKLKV